MKGEESYKINENLRFMQDTGLKMSPPSDHKTLISSARDKSGQTADDQFRIRRFNLAGGQEIKLYCRLVKSRRSVAASFRLYEDRQGLKWMDITVNDQSCLISISDKSFEQQVAEELLTLGFNKYSG